MGDTEKLSLFEFSKKHLCGSDVLSDGRDGQPRVLVRGEYSAVHVVNLGL